ncbi:hypothetical protein [Streptomyces sp. NPDC007088]|uniref:hypothetical protein n=1 Tax=Streptomyces sp. NPDC007088 TaxID=3364773 RepID=UPI0036C0D6CF
MINILFAIITVLLVASFVVALITVLKPGVSQRTRQRAFRALTAVELLATVAHLMSGHALVGTLLAALTVPMLLGTWEQASQTLARWDRARKREKPTK